MVRVHELWCPKSIERLGVVLQHVVPNTLSGSRHARLAYRLAWQNGVGPRDLLLALGSKLPGCAWEEGPLFLTAFSRLWDTHSFT